MRILPAPPRNNSMKPPLYAISMRALSGTMGVCLLGAVGCTTKTAAHPSELYSNVGTGQVGGLMRMEAASTVRRTPPRLPTIIKNSSLASGENTQPPPPPAPHLKSSANPVVVSPVPEEADGYFAGMPAETSPLGTLFGSVFVPPAPPTSTTLSTATYQEVK